MRLGLVLGKLGEQNGITVAGDEVQRAIMARARQFPGQEQQVFQFTPTTSRPRRKSARPCSRTRWWTSSPNWPRSTTSQVDRETLFKDPDDLPESIKQRPDPRNPRASERYIKRAMV